MTIYYILEAVLLMGLVMGSSVQFSSERSRKVIFYTLVVLLTFLACFRDVSVGKDTQYYIRLFNTIRSVRWVDLWSFSRQTGYEIGYVVYNKFLSLISSHGQVVTIGNSLILMLLAAQFTRKECSNPILGLYVFYAIGIYQSSFNIASSLIAAYIVFSGIDSIRNRKLIKYSACVLVATLFHTAAIMMIVLYFVYNAKINTKRILVFLGGGIAIAFFLSRILVLATRFIPLKYTRYMTRASDNGMILLFHLLILGAVFIVQMASSKTLAVNDERDIRIHTWSVMLEIVFLMMAIRIDIFTRVAYFFMPSLPIFIDKAIEKTDQSGNRRLLYSGLVVAIGLQYIIRLQVNNIGGSIPYMFFF